MKAFEEKVQRTIRCLTQDGMSAMARDIIQRRLAWLNEHMPEDRFQVSPRQAYELLFFDQMALPPAELQVVSETAHEIVWLSTNRCPLLEACQALRLDTRTVCRPVNERATQAFLSRIDPRLRFHRSYEEIRPHAGHCREWIVRLDFDYYMGVADQEARLSGGEENDRHGAVVVLENRIIAQAYHNMAVSQQSPGAHAEVRALRLAQRAMGDDLCGAVLFSTSRPCSFCTSLAEWAKVTTIVHPISASEIAEVTGQNAPLRILRAIEDSPDSPELIGLVWEKNAP